VLEIEPAEYEMRSYLTEFIGAFFLVLTVCLTVPTGSPFAPIAIGCVLMVMVYMGGHISGGHYNPAVSLAACLRGALPSSRMAGYMMVQLAGAVVAALIAYYLTGKSFACAPGAEVHAVKALLVEFLFTFALALVVLNTATVTKTAGNSYFGLAIGMTVLVGAFAGGSISGGAFNPAVGLGPMAVQSLVGSGSLEHFWLYVVGPLAGGLAAATVFQIQHAE
jgi:aquaporin Z